MAASIAGKPVTMAAKHPASRPGRMPEIGSKRSAAIGCTHGGITAGKPFSRGGQITCTTRGRMPKIESKRSAAIGYTYGGRQSPGKPVPVAVINHLHLHIHSYPGMVRNHGHKPRNGRCRPAGIPCYSKQYQHKTFIIGDFRKALAFAVTINKKGGFKWERSKNG